MLRSHGIDWRVSMAFWLFCTALPYGSIRKVVTIICGKKKSRRACTRQISVTPIRILS